MAQAKLRRILQPDRGGDRLLGCGLGQFSVCGRFAIRAMNNAGFGTALVRRDLPLFSRGSHQHRPRPGAQFPILLKRMRNRTRAANHLNAEKRILVNIGGRREFRNHLGPIRVHFVSQNHRQGSLNSLAELQPVHRDQDLAIRLDVDEGVRRIDFRIGLCPFLRGQREIQIQ